MTLQNRVTPFGEILALPQRGTMMGNRGGRIHDADRRLGRRRWASKAWICCLLAFKGRREVVMAPGHYTQLFFLDEATALAAGHRPCALCRRPDFNRFMDLIGDVLGANRRPLVAEADAILHRERVGSDGGKRLARASARDLPPGSFVSLLDGSPCLVTGEGLRPWSAGGYLASLPMPDGEVDLLTPPTIVEVLRRGYRPGIHASAGDAAGDTGPPFGL
ncbi:MAG: hypothetical protein R3D33_14915 [Hyphomicrobiaceae bacterium]